MLSYYYEPATRPFNPALPARRIPPAVGSDTIGVDVFNGAASQLGTGASDEDVEKKAKSIGIGVILGVAAIFGLVIAMAASDRGPLPPSK
jgi:hypothetical protein